MGNLYGVFVYGNRTRARPDDWRLLVGYVLRTVVLL